jgi:hypothetical protein
MYRWLIAGFLFAAGLLFSGCLEVKEEVVFGKNFSGTMKYTLDMSGMADMVKMLGNMNTETAVSESPMEKMTEAMKMQETAVKSVSGVKNVKQVGKPDKFLYTLQFDFENIDALNRAMNAVTGSQANGYVLSADKKTLTKTLKLPNAGSLGELAGSDSLAQGMEMAKMFLKDAKYTLNYSFKKRVKQAGCDGATVSQQKKATKIEIPFTQLMESEKQIIGKIELK